mmetsp:Transcript_18368/g.54577  ORF Transcript_18368/g.54577 Transcript_18368/m.54577 type:complete len:335 (+) Transcript_18368:226-1230(+)
MAALDAMTDLAEPASAEPAENEFVYVWIPCDEKPMRELVHTKNSTLEDDDLREVLKKHFARNALSGEGLTAYCQGLKAQIEEKMKESGTAKIDDLDGRVNAIARGVAVDTFALTMPSKEDPEAISLYVDEKGSAKQLPVNARAVGLAAACGHADQQFRGDVFLSRYFDDEPNGGEAWLRRDLRLAEVATDAPWVASAVKRARAAKTPGGMASMSALYEQLGGGAGGGPLKLDAREEERKLMEQEHTSENYAWTQTEGDVEIRVPVAAGTTSRGLSVDIKRSSLKVGPKGGAALVDVKLSAPVDVDCSTWYLDGSTVVVTLEKARGARWDTLAAE